MKQRPEEDADQPLAGSRPPEYVIVTWACEQFATEPSATASPWLRPSRPGESRIASPYIRNWETGRPSDHCLG